MTDSKIFVDRIQNIILVFIEVESKAKSAGPKFEPQIFPFVKTCPLEMMQIRYLTAALLWPSVHMRPDIHLCHGVWGGILCADEVVKTLC